jgi:hypothetical protein
MARAMGRAWEPTSALAKSHDVRASGRGAELVVDGGLIAVVSETLPSNGTTPAEPARKPTALTMLIETLL